ncbi:hypothetical protein B0H19DRAFT_112818 [Mycena capillaripes]|nr:hypothetical protein B0H19DRAFT_112818 [Mycena capillaripes]
MDLQEATSIHIKALEHQRDEAAVVVAGLQTAREDAATEQSQLIQTFKAELDSRLDDMRSMLDAESRKREADIAELRLQAEARLQAANEEAIGLLKSLVVVQNGLVGLSENAVALNDVTETQESISRCLQDIIFDVRRSGPPYPVLTQGEKDVLKQGGLGYVTQLIKPPTYVKADADNLRLKALSILSTEQQGVCRVLMDKLDERRSQRNLDHHPRPDFTTALARIGALPDEGHLILRQQLTEDVKRLPLRHERGRTDVDLRLFTPPERLNSQQRLATRQGQGDKRM